MATDPKTTPQMRAWMGDFGQRYNDRNTLSIKSLDIFYKKMLGTTLTQLNEQLLPADGIGTILEVGCNIGMKLRHLQHQGYKNLYGIEIQADAVERAKQHTKDMHIIRGSAFDIPFKDNYFDLVFTSGVLIHIDPKDLRAAMEEMVRCSKKYISGFEYFSEAEKEAPYRGNKSLLWKNNFPKLFQEYFPSLKLLKCQKYRYLEDSSLCDVAYLFEKNGK